MDGFELNKIAGAILVTALTVTVIGHVGDILIPTEAADHGEGASQMAAVPSGAGAAKPEKTEEPLPVRLAQATVEEGEGVARRCVACHSFEEGGANKVGPNLHGVVGSARGAVEGFNYSSGFGELEGEWTYARLDEFLTNPKDVVPGTKMSFRLTDAQDRAHVIAYLKSISPGAPPFPEPQPQQAAAEGEQATDGAEGGEATGDEQAAEAEQAAEEGETQAAEAEVEAEPEPAADPMMQAFAEASAQDGESVARRCQACHSFEEGGPNKVGPNLHGIVGRERGSVENFGRYSQGLKEMGGQWDYASLFEYLENPGDYVEGSRMPFKLTDPGDRADVIAYLKSISPGAPPLPGQSE